jgi:hypothetical protein
LLERRAIQVLLVDFHAAILRERGVDPGEVHSALEAIGYRRATQSNQFDGYVTYTPSSRTNASTP